MKTFTEFVNENIDTTIPFSVFTQKRNFTNCCTIEKTTGKSVLIKAINQPEGEVRFWLANELFSAYVETGKVLPRFLKINLLSPDLKPL